MSTCFKPHNYDRLELNESTSQVESCVSQTLQTNGESVRKTTVPILTPENVWQVLQEEAEAIVAPGGKLIANPLERNKRINSAYAALWLDDHRFQWAGLAAFASKQVGCGLLHANQNIEKALIEMEAMQAQAGLQPPYLSPKTQGAGAASVTVFNMLALGNTTLFLDIFPLHAFYKKRGLANLKNTIKFRKNILNYNPAYKVLWPAGENRLKFARDSAEIAFAFECIDQGNLKLSVEFFARHEQVHILQPTIYEDLAFKGFLRANQMAYVTKLSGGTASAVELTLASQCQSASNGQTIGFNKNAIADLSDVNQRMEFVLRVAGQFDQMVNGAHRTQIKQALMEIRAGFVSR